ncbi:MAG: 4Fe-4S binding protein [Candidatus Nezhaarchaeota archaeon]|nr:4Fe-4S binding protein [Candidatus Nezhaarchaeota archaeon]
MSRKNVKKGRIKIDEAKCNGCGACIPACLEGALRIVNGKAKLVDESACDGLGACIKECPKDAIAFEDEESEGPERGGLKRKAELSVMAANDYNLNWPVKLELINPRAPILEKCHLVVTADCVPFIYKAFHDEVKGGVVVSGCAILGDKDLYRDKVMGILKHNDVVTIKVLRVEVPCCSNLTKIVGEALRKAEKQIKVEEAIVNVDGKLKHRSEV